MCSMSCLHRQLPVRAQSKPEGVAPSLACCHDAADGWPLLRMRATVEAMPKNRQEKVHLLVRPGSHVLVPAEHRAGVARGRADPRHGAPCARPRLGLAFLSLAAGALARDSAAGGVTGIGRDAEGGSVARPQQGRAIAPGRGPFAGREPPKRAIMMMSSPSRGWHWCSKLSRFG